MRRRVPKWFGQFAIFAGVAVLGAGSAQDMSTAASAPKLEFHLARQPVGDALTALGQQTGLTIVVDSVAGREVMASELNGQYTADEALRKILESTGLRAKYLDRKTVQVVDERREVGASENQGNSLVAQGSAESEEQSASTADGGKGEKLEEIVVTAQKRKERLIDVPMSITAKSGDELVARDITTIQDLSYVVPSLSVFEAGPAHQLISIRGISSTRGKTPLTGVYLDEMPLSGVQDGSFPAYPDLRVIDLDRVEVLKGPQGTLYGEGAAGGLIRFITKDPNLSRMGGDFRTEFSNTAKGGWSEAVTGVVNLPLASEVFGIRVAAKYENIAGWIDQPSVGRKDINDDEVKHVRVKALYAPTANLRIKGMAEIHRDDFGAMNIVNQSPLEDSHFVQAFDISAPTNGQNDYDMFNLVVTYDFPFAELLSSSSYAKIDSTQTITEMVYQPGQIPVYQPGQPAWLEILALNNEHHSSIASQELRLTSAGTGPFHWTVGSNYKQPKLTSGSQDGSSLSLFGGAARYPGFLAGTAGTERIKSWAGFADVSYQFAGHVEVGGGFRYSSYKDETWDPNASPQEVESITSSKPTYRGYIKYAFSPDANIYFNAGTGFRAGGHNDVQKVALGAPAEILPENTLSYELGMKAGLLDHRLRLASAAFYSKYRDMITSRNQFINGVVVGYQANGQNAKVKGVEAEIDWAATERLTLTLAGDVTDTEITEVDPLEPNPQYAVGDLINFVPKYSVSASADYRFRWSGSIPGYFQLMFDRKGKQSDSERGVGLLIVKQLLSPELSFLNASVGAEWNGWSWSLFGRNLLDEDSLINPNAWGWAAQARPRTFGVMASKRF